MKLILKLILSSILLSSSAFAQTTYISLSPAHTEIIYALNAQDNLLGVSTECNFPQVATKKPHIGNSFFINIEKIISLNPDYIFALNSAKPTLSALSFLKATPIYTEFNSVNDIYRTIAQIGELTHKQPEASALIKSLKHQINNTKTHTPKKILYLLQAEPFITIGKNSFITELIQLSGHISVTSTLPYTYPTVSLEYLLTTAPDIIILWQKSSNNELKKLFPTAQIYNLTQEQRDLLSRPSPRIPQAIKTFATLDFQN